MPPTRAGRVTQPQVVEAGEVLVPVMAACAGEFEGTPPGRRTEAALTHPSCNSSKPAFVAIRLMTTSSTGPGPVHARDAHGLLEPGDSPRCAPARPRARLCRRIGSHARARDRSQRRDLHRRATRRAQPAPI